MNLWDGTTQERIAKLWRAIRHCEKRPNCRVVLRDENNNFSPAIIPTQTIAPGEELTINFRIVSPALLDGFPELATIVADKLAAHDEAKMLKRGPLIEANEHLYHANKTLSAENVNSESKLAHVRHTLNALVSKISAQTGKPVGNTGPLTQRLRDAVHMLYTQSSSGDAEKSATMPVDSNSLEVMMLAEQLKKLNVLNERLATELVDLKKQHAGQRNRKKESAGLKKL